MYFLLTLSLVMLYFRDGSAQYFFSPPNSNVSEPYTATLGETIQALWQCPYSDINFNVYGPLQNGWYNYLILFTNQPNNNSYTFGLGQSLLGLSADGGQSNNTKYWLKIEEVDPDSGNTTGRWFSTQEFFVYLPATDATSSAMTLPTTSNYFASSATVITTSTVTGAWASTWTTSTVSTTTVTTPQVSAPASGTDTGQLAAAAATASQTATLASPSSGYSEDQKIAIGIGIGIGLPTIIVALLTLWATCLRGH